MSPLLARVDGRARIAIIVLIAVAILVPVLALATPPRSTFHMPPYLVALFGKYLCFALLAGALDLVWGY
ncbi:MAG: urea ABC transporter permease subunit UrtC, partial [Microvirga sp.]